jgi:hypothetical protein
MESVDSVWILVLVKNPISLELLASLVTLLTAFTAQPLESVKIANPVSKQTRQELNVFSAIFRAVIPAFWTVNVTNVVQDFDLSFPTSIPVWAARLLLEPVDTVRQ